MTTSNSIPHLAISSYSLSHHPSHLLPTKLHAAASAGFTGIEIFHADLVVYATHLNATHLQTAHRIRCICNDLNLSIIALSSLDNFEGMPTPLEPRLQVAREWVELARALGTGVVQVPSTYDAAAREAWARGEVDEESLVDDLCALIELGVGDESKSEGDVTFAYEWMPWSLISIWQDAVRVVRKVRARSSRGKIGLCCDTFHLLAGVWADCRREDGKQEGGDTALATSLAAFRTEVRLEEIVYVQLSDAETMRPPLSEAHSAWQVEVVDGKESGRHQANALCSWGRRFPLEVEKGAYFPMRDVTMLWLKELGWKGWVSMEIFNRELRDEATLPEDKARKGMESWRRVQGMMEE